MEPHAFVKEVHRRMALRHAAFQPPVPWAEMAQTWSRCWIFADSTMSAFTG